MFNFKEWLEANRDKLKPPVSNKDLMPESDEFIVMVVGGPNARKDYHINETEEFFYQLEGTAMVKTQVGGKVVEHTLNAGDMFLCPANVPHSPGRMANSIGLVIERKRAGKGFLDGLAWYCDECNHPLHGVRFELVDIEKDFLPHFKHFYGSEELRTCDNCGHVMETDPRFTEEG